jgi:hypothetical protein
MKIPATIVVALAIYFAISISPSDAVAFATSFVSPDTIAVVTAVGTVVSEERLIYRNGISPLLKEKLGIELGKSTIAKLFSPAVGQGCEPACYWNKRPLYRPTDVLAWAKSRLRPGPAIMPMSAEESPATAAEETTLCKCAIDKMESTCHHTTMPTAADPRPPDAP